MKTIYVTYLQNGILKKGVINESKYTELKANNFISDLIIYPNELIMEQNYNSISGKGGDAKQILHG